MKSKTSKLISLSIVAVAFVIGLGSCNDNRVANVNSKYKINPNKYAKIYMPQARQVNKAALEIKDTTYTFIYGAAYAGPTTAPHDIKVKFSINPAMVDSFNNQNLTSYLPLPQGSYKLGKTSAVIPAGGRATSPLNLKVDAHGYITGGEKNYLLPITMTEESGNIKTNKKLQTTYFVFHGPNLKIIKSKWTIIDYTGAYSDAYSPKYIIDGDDNSFWLIVAPLPWYFTIDMGKKTLINGFNLVGHVYANDNINFINRNPKKVTFEFSSDGKNWRDAESFTLPFISDPSSDVSAKVELSKPVKARYFKFTINTTVGGQEIGNFNEITAF
jgi:hypothetical protein